jgi:hypothetical protein
MNQDENTTNIQISESIFNKIGQLTKTKKGKIKILITIIILIILVLLLITVYNRYIKHNKSATVASTITDIFKGQENNSTNQNELSKLDNLSYSKDTANRHPLAVMIENHPDARPQSGLGSASVVYEAIAEGGITRFMAVFGPNAPEKVGPVRSARTYYLDWALEYDAFYSHVGGNIDALDLIPQIGIKDLDQFRYGTEAYWRIPQAGKATEHTMYTNAVKLYNIANNNKWNMSSNFAPNSFKDDLPKDQRPTSQSVNINFSSESYDVNWVYEPNNNVYLREMAGAPHKDALTNEQIKAKNIVIQEVNRQAVITRINENGWKMNTVGSGKARVFIDGKETEATWKKADRNSRTKFSDTSGKEIEFDAGATWYEIVPPETPITVK